MMVRMEHERMPANATELQANEPPPVHNSHQLNPRGPAGQAANASKRRKSNKKFGAPAQIVTRN